MPARKKGLFLFSLFVNPIKQFIGIITVQFFENFILFQGGALITELQIRKSQAVMRIGIIRLEPDSLFESVNCLLVAPEPTVGLT